MKNLARIVALLGILSIGGAVENAHASQPGHPVGLWEATSPPTVMAYVRPDGRFVPSHDRKGRPCRRKGHHRGYFSDVSAYRWNGMPLGGQRWDNAALTYYWADHDDFAVVYDGLSWFNDTSSPVIVAGWCE